VSLQSVGEGYDIISFEDDGSTRRYLEVKSTVGRGSVVDISRGEWRAAKRFRERYYLVRVMDTKTLPVLHFVRDPFQLDLKQAKRVSQSCRRDSRRFGTYHKRPADLSVGRQPCLRLAVA